MRVSIKHFNGQAERGIALAYAQKAGLQKFYSLRFQFGRIPEGDYEIEKEHMFSNQYNTKGKNDHPGYRIFEYREIIENCVGYYISSGIEEIRAYQAELKSCNYCGKQYFKSSEKYCDKCRGSEYLKPDNYHLLRLTNIREKPSKTPLPQEIVDDIEAKQKIARQKRLEKRQADKLASCQKSIENAKKEFEAYQWLIDHDLDFDNVIYYNHTDTFCFGWRNALTDDERNLLGIVLLDFPFSYSFE